MKTKKMEVLVDSKAAAAAKVVAAAASGQTVIAAAVVVVVAAVEVVVIGASVDARTFPAWRFRFVIATFSVEVGHLQNHHRCCCSCRCRWGHHGLLVLLLTKEMIQ